MADKIKQPIRFTLTRIPNEERERLGLATYPRRRGSGWGIFAFGLIVGAAGWIFQQALAQHHAECASGLGQLAQGFSSSAQNACTTVSTYWTVASGAMILGVIFMVVGLVVAVSRGSGGGVSPTEQG